ncbi:MAG: parallel beta-helix repeat protein [Saprospiraceae bacterium]|jgi:parallel beta-helix repeat protein
MLNKPICLIFLFIQCCFSLSATTYFISNNGNDANTGLSLPGAFETIQYAADIVVAGDSVLVENGNYTGFALWNGGTSGAPIVFKTLGNEVVINMPCTTNDGINIENANYVILDGFKVINQPRNGIRLALANHCIVRNCVCDHNFERGIFTGFTDDIIIEYNICSNSEDEHGIYVSNSSDRPIIRYNECFGNNNIGIHMNGDLSQGGDGIISDAQVYGNILHDNNLAAGLNMDGVENPIVYNNLIYNNHNSQGIALFQQDGAIPTRGAEIFNNTIIVPDDGRWGILVNSGSNVNTNIFNNIILNQHAWRGCISTESIEDFSSDTNILNDKMSASGDGSTISFQEWQALGLDLNSQVVDNPNEVFVSFSQNDFHLLENSPAVDAGNNVAFLSTDLEGNPRPIGTGFDIGAYEYQGTTALADILVKSNISFHPNPFKMEIFIDNTSLKDLTFSLKNINGQQLYQGKVVEGKISIGGDIPRGTYALTIKTKEGRILHTGLIVKI